MVCVGIPVTSKSFYASEVKLNTKFETQPWLLPKSVQIRKCLMVSVFESDVNYFLGAGLPTISLRAFMSIACGTVLNACDANMITEELFHVNLLQIAQKRRQIDYTLLFRSHSFRSGLTEIVQECLALIRKDGMGRFLALAIQTVPVLSTMSAKGYPISIRDAEKELYKLKETRSVIGDQIKGLLQDSPTVDDTNLTYRELRCLRARYKKTGEKIKLYTKYLYIASETGGILPCKYNSIGTDSFRITTTNVNIQGLPKALRECLRPHSTGNLLLEYDVVSSQLALLSYLAEEKALIEQYEQGNDLYLFILEELTGKQITSKKERDAYKHMILQFLYGAGTRTLQAELESNGISLSVDTVTKTLSNLFQMFPFIDDYIRRLKVTDITVLPDGRKWMVENIEPYKRLAFVLQYIEAFILRRVLVLLNRKSANMELWSYLSIHDSIWIEAGRSCRGTAPKIVSACYQKAMKELFPQCKNVQIKEEIIYEKKVY